MDIENVPRLDEKAKEILRKLGETYGNNYTDPKSATYHNPDLIPSKSKIQKEIKSQGVKASSRTISRYLLEGIERAKGSQLASQIFCQIWTDRERLSPEVKEYIRQKGESYTKQYLNPASKMCKNPDEIPSIKQIKKELTENNIDVNAQSISKYLREGTNRVVSQDAAPKIFQEMWPGPNRLEKDQRDAIRLRGENIARQYTDPTSHLYQNKDVIPSIYQIRKEFAAQGIHAENSIFSKYLQEGIVRAINPVQASLIFRELWPDPKITELKPEYQEIIRQRGEFYAKEYLDPSSEISHYPDKIPPLSKIQQELRDQGIMSERHTISKYLKEGVERATGSDIAPQVFRDMWAKNTKLTPEVQESIRQYGELYVKNYMDPKSEEYQNPDAVPSIKQIHKELKSQGVKAGSRAISKYLKEGVNRIVGSDSGSKIFNEIWSERNKIPPEIKEDIRQKGESYAKKYDDPKSDIFKNADQIPSIKQIKRELTSQNVTLDAKAVGKYLFEGIERRVGPDLARQYYNTFWPEVEKLTPEIQEKIRQMGAGYAKQFIDPESKNFLDPGAVPSKHEIRIGLEKQGIIVSDNSVSKYLKQGVGSEIGLDRSTQIYQSLWPILELPSNMQEKIGQIFIADAKNIEAGNEHLVKPMTYWEKELGAGKNSIARYGKIGLQKEYGDTKGIALYEQRNALLNQNRFLGVTTHTIFENTFKNAVRENGINWFNEVKLPLPDPGLAKEYVKVDSAVRLSPEQAKKIFYQSSNENKTLLEELGFNPNIIANTREVMVDFTNDSRAINSVNKVAKYAVDKDGNIIPDRVFLIVVPAQDLKNGRVSPVPNDLLNTRIVNMDLFCDLFQIQDKYREILNEALQNSERHDLVAQQALKQQLGYNLTSDSDAYWLAKTGHVPDLRYWHDLTEYMSGLEGNSTPETSPATTQENKQTPEKEENAINKKEVEQDKTKAKAKEQPNDENNTQPSPIIPDPPESKQEKLYPSNDAPEKNEDQNPETGGINAANGIPNYDRLAEKGSPTRCSSARRASRKPPKRSRTRPSSKPSRTCVT